MKNMNDKVYAIVKWSYEFDDLDYGDYWPYFLSLNKDKVIDKFNEIKKEETIRFNEDMKMDYVKRILAKYPERVEDFQIVEDTEDMFKIYFDNWCYNWKLTEFKLDTIPCVKLEQI